MIREELINELKEKFSFIKFNVKIKKHFNEEIIVLDSEELDIMIFKQCKSKKDFHIRCKFHTNFDYLNYLIDKLDKILKKYDFYLK
jgi:hypothetical protein